jgi:hypothetical protein
LGRLRFSGRRILKPLLLRGREILKPLLPRGREILKPPPITGEVAFPLFSPPLAGGARGGG